MKMVERMASGYETLSEKEKQTLRLIVRGHDAKSIARHLELSVHTVNERLRDARRKLGVSSSREAARMVLGIEGDAPEKFGDTTFGDAPHDPAAHSTSSSDAREMSRRVAWIAGALLMTFIIGLIALSQAMTGAPAGPAGNAAPSTASAETEVAGAARNWLALSDQGRWADAYRQTGRAFQKSNTLSVWTSAAQKVRPPLGALVSRTLISQDSVPAGENGVEVVKFRTSFANKTEAIETVSLSREGGQWKVVGIYVE